MKNLLLTPAFILAGIFYVQGQILLQEDFEAPSLSSGWSIQTNATDGGWKIGTPAALSSQSFTIVDNVTVEVTPDLDAELTKLKERAFGEENTPFPVGGQIFNSGEITLILSDLTGKRFMSYQSTGKAQELDLSALPDGMYLISIRNNDLIATRKLVLKKIIQTWTTNIIPALMRKLPIPW